MLRRFKDVVNRCAAVPAISDEHQRVTFAELDEMVDALVALLAGPKGTPPVVVLALPGGPRFSAVQIAGLATSAIIVPVAADTTAVEAEQLASVVEPQLLVVESPSRSRALLAAWRKPVTTLCQTTDGAHECGHPLLRWGEVMAGSTAPLQVEDPSIEWPADAAILQFTSGSSGRPKGIVLTRANLRAYLDHQRSFLDRFAGQQVFCPVPQSHSYGGTVVLEHLFHGVGVHVANRFMPAADLQRMQRDRCAGLLAPPNYVRMLAQLGGLSPEHLPDLAWVNIGTATVDQGLVRDLRILRAGLRLYLRYGLTETMGYIAHLELGPGEELSDPGLVGVPIAGVELADLPALSETAREVRVRGPSVARCALVAGGHFEALVDGHGELATGDLACIDERGRLHLRGRISSFLKRNGFRINPFEIEDLLRAQPGVADAVIIGTDDALAGQRLIAVVELEPQVAPAPQPDQLLQVCRAQLSAYKVPQECRLVSTLPRTRSGKPDRPRILSLHGTDERGLASP